MQIIPIFFLLLKKLRPLKLCDRKPSTTDGFNGASPHGHGNRREHRAQFLPPVSEISIQAQHP